MEERVKVRSWKIISITILVLFILLTGQAKAKNKIDKMEFERGEIAGRLLKSALIIDAYYEFCFPSGTERGSYTAGVIKLVKEKFGFDMLDTINNSEKSIGRNIVRETFTEVEKDLGSIGGCDSRLIPDWKVLAHEQYQKSLKEFHGHNK